jgi:chemotaxis regulatin CheY-phosphate phosphatase CheZ
MNSPDRLEADAAVLRRAAMKMLDHADRLQSRADALRRRPKQCRKPWAVVIERHLDEGN